MCKITKKEDIYKIENFNLDLLKEAIRQAELKMQDEHNRKIRIDTRVYLMFPFISSWIAWIIKEYYQLPPEVVIKNNVQYIVIIIFVTLIFSAIFLFLAIRPQRYAGIGRLPDIWLKTEVIGCKDDDPKYGRILTKILLDYKESILETFKTNNNRISYLEKAFYSFLSSAIWVVILPLL